MPAAALDRSDPRRVERVWRSSVGPPATSAHRPGPFALLGLQRAVGNRAVAQLINVQRCGPVPADRCGCHTPDAGSELTDEDRPGAGSRILDAESVLRLQRHAGNAAVAALPSRKQPVAGTQSGSGSPHIVAGARVPIQPSTVATARPVVQRDLGFEFQLRDNKIKTSTGREFGRKDGKFFHKVGGLELQTEHGSFMEFETEHFRKWSDLEAQISAAVGVVRAIMADPKAFPFNQEKRLRKEGILRRGEKLEVDVQDSTFLADLQWTEGLDLKQYQSLLKEHERNPVNWVAPVITDADKILNDARTASKKVKAGANLDSLRGFLQIILNYIHRGQELTWDKSQPPEVVKATFRLMMRTSFSSVFQAGLSADEKQLFSEILKSGAIPQALGISAGDPFFKNGYWGDLGGGLKGFFEGGMVTALSRGGSVHDCSAATPTPGITSGKCMARIAGSNITVGSWLNSIAQQAKDTLSPAAHGSGSMGSLSMKSRGPEKRLAVLEVRGSESLHREQPVSNWLNFTEEVFKRAAMCRARPGTGTGLVYDYPPGPDRSFNSSLCP